MKAKVLKPGRSMRRRAFIALLGGSAARPVAASTQQLERLYHIGVLTEDSEMLERIGAFKHRLEQLGWDDGRNFRIELRAGGELETSATALVASAPDVIVVIGNPGVVALQRLTRVIPKWPRL
jgi:putative tryptophan/tyrosine transport system substrate-binding protein